MALSFYFSGIGGKSEILIRLLVGIRLSCFSRRIRVCFVVLVRVLLIVAIVVTTTTTTTSPRFAVHRELITYCDSLFFLQVVRWFLTPSCVGSQVIHSATTVNHYFIIASHIIIKGCFY